ncbi:MAG: hypothetical protein R2706_11065 [Acidimicrobiales bacterium]
MPARNGPQRSRVRGFEPGSITSDLTLVDRWDSISAGNIKNETYWQLTDCNGWYDIGTIGGSASEAGTHYLLR